MAFEKANGVNAAFLPEKHSIFQIGWMKYFIGWLRHGR
jgi:hypothetical protein